MNKLILIICLIFSCLSIDCAELGPLPFHYTQHPAVTGMPIKVIPIYVDTTFGEMDKLAIDDAVNQWNYALNGYIKLKVVSTTFDMEPEVINEVMVKGNGWLMLKIDSNNTIVHDTPAGRPLAFVNEVGGNRIYFIRERFISEAMMGITLHEIGHLLGAQHDNVYLMHPHYGWHRYRCVDKHAMQEVATYWRLDMNRVNYCEYGEAGYNPFGGQEKSK